MTKIIIRMEMQKTLSKEDINKTYDEMKQAFDAVLKMPMFGQHIKEIDYILQQ